MKAEIQFGTSGWRAVISDEFSFANVRRAVTGIARYVAAESLPARALSWAAGEQIQELFGKVGSFYPERSNFRLTPDAHSKFTIKLKAKSWIFD
jgi:hypothetical protein